MASESVDPRRGWLARLVAYTIASFIVSLMVGIVVAPLPFMDWADGNFGQLVEAYHDIVTGLARFEPDFMVLFLAPAATVALVQAGFLLPIFRPPQASDRPKAMRWSIACAAIVGAVVVAGLAWTLLELATWEQEAMDVVGGPAFFAVAIGAFVPGWLAWTWVLGRRSERADPLGLDRMLLPLLVGSGLSFALIVPLDALVRRKKDCYCATGSFFALCMGIAACIWFLGPCLVLGLSRKRRRWARRHACLACGYERQHGHAATRSERCPECGRSWTKRRRRRTEQAPRTAGG